MEKQEFKHLFSPLRIGNVTVPNRIFFSPHAHLFHPPTMPPNERARYYYEARAKGGAGLITTTWHSPCWTTTMGYHSAYEDDSVIPALKKVTDAIHENGAKAFAQLYHLGNVVSSHAFGGGAIYSASAIPRIHPFAPRWQDVPHQMDLDEIKRFIQAFGNIARRMRQAGYDGIEIGSMWGMLPASFMSPAMNHRTDQYGGSLENRMRFLLEIIDAIRANVGPDFVVGVRFTADEFINGGLTLDDGKEIAKKLEATGKLDYLYPCADAYGAGHIPPMYFPLAAFTYIAAGIKEVVSLPVFTVGRINDPVPAERILANHQADMIGMVRGLIADPELPNKAREGRLDEIRRCIGCLDGCCSNAFENPPITCSINPEAGKEKELAIIPAGSKKSVMVIGEGAAGLETARVAALRGHRVSLYEKNDVLAKELSIAAIAEGREGFEDAVRYYTYQMKLLGVDVHLGVTVTPEMVLKQNYDAVVIATGAVPFIPELPGANGSSVVEMRQALQDEVEVGQNVIVADCQHHIYGLDVADFLADKGKRVELLTESVYAGSLAPHFSVGVIYTRLLRKGVVITPLTRVKEIRGNTIVACNVLTNAERLIEGVDTVVFCTDGRADDSLYHSLKGQVKELYEVGQCVSPRKLPDSTYDGALVGRKL